MQIFLPNLFKILHTYWFPLSVIMRFSRLFYGREISRMPCKYWHLCNFCNSPSSPNTVKQNSPVTRLDLLTHLDDYKIGSRLLFAGNLTRQPYMKGTKYRISGDLTNTDNVMNNTFWIEVQPVLTKEMLEFAASKIESYFGVNF